MEQIFQRTVKEDPINKNDFLFVKLQLASELEQIKSKVDLREKITTAIINQGLLNSCSACALAVAAELHIADKQNSFNHLQNRQVSAMFIYYHERIIENKINKNSAVFIKDGIKALAKHGACSEKLWPYPSSIPLPSALLAQLKTGTKQDIISAIAQAEQLSQVAIDKALSTVPSRQAKAQASHFLSPNYYKLAIDNGLNEVKLALSKGIPVVFGFNEPLSFFNTPKSGIMAMPKTDEPRLGGHAVIAVGFDDEKKALLIRNSYGTSFANNGYCYMPYEFVLGSYQEQQQKRANTFSFWCLLANNAT